MEEIIAALLDTSALQLFTHLDGPAYLIVILFVFLLAKLAYDLFTPYKLNEQLTTQDNKAAAVSFAGYMFAVGIVIFGVYTSEPDAGYAAGRVELLWDLGSVLVWSVIGIALLNIARFINDKVLLRKFDNVKEIVADRNVGAGVVELGSYIGSALIIRAALFGEDVSFIAGVVGTLIYFILGQFGFIVFSWLYQLISRYDLHAEIEKDNVSAGVAFGSGMIAVAILLSGFIMRYDSLPGFLAWFVASLFFLIVSRYIVDKLLLPGSLLDEEISKDQNWGAALIEGGTAIIIAMLLVPVFLG